MSVRKSEAVWNGNLRDGRGIMRPSSGAFEVAYSFPTRFEESPGTNPEELIGAAHAGCFSMALADNLAEAGYKPESVHTVASVYFEKVDGGFGITRIFLQSEAQVPAIDDESFQKMAEAAKNGCPVSRALAAVPIELDAKLM